MRAWELGLIEHQGGGLYRSAQSRAGEQFFSEGHKSSQERRFSLWLEPVITFAGLARLNFDFGWPKEMIGTQSVDWALDLVAFLPDQQNEFIAGEVKKTRIEIENMIDFMENFGHDPALTEPDRNFPKARNAYKKVAALRARNAPIFWALGPDRFSKVYCMKYHANASFDMILTDNAALKFPGV